jgi:heat shock protein HtpX
MFATRLAPYVLLALIALMPGAISWWSGRRLARLADDPAFPELFAAHGRRNRAMLFIAMVSLGCATSLMLSAVAIPLIFAGLLVFAGFIAAAYPLRRALYHETWSFGSYFCFYPRVIGGLFGFWILLASLPNLAALAGTWDWLAAGALGGLLVLWNIHYAEIVRSCLRTRPIPEGAFLVRCRALAATSGVPQPRFERIDLGGGVIANALALPSLRTPSVVFTDTLLERFDEKELLGICAHELAHFEHFNPGYLRRLNYVTYIVLAIGVAFAPVVRLASLDSGPWPGLLWFAAFLSSMAMRARHKQRQETICDLRAVELTGDADGLIRGLTKLYTLARMPRRLEQQTERSATHPSLARRIRDIRRAARVAPVTLGGAERFTSADGRTVVVFDVAELRWVQPDAVTHSVSYSGLTELRVDARPSRGSRLIAVSAEARRWEMSLADSDVARLQAVLDVVDGTLGDPPRPPALHPRIQRAAVLMAATTILALSQTAVAFVALLAWVRPSLPLLVGAGLATLAAAGLVFRDHGSIAYFVEVVLPLAVIGLVLLGLAWGHRHDHRDRMRPFIALLALPAAIGLVALTMSGFDVVRLHQSARTMPSATVLLVALAGALACSTARRVRLSAMAVGVGALAITLVASTAFLERFATDPFLVDAPALDWVSVGSDAIAEFEVPSGTSRINLSPNGQYVAVYQDVDSEDDHASTFQIGRIGEALISITAEDVAFVDNDQVFVVLSDSRGTTLKTVRLGPPRDVVREQFLEDLSDPSLSFDRATGRWRVMGWGSDRSIMRVEGRIGSSDVLKKRWPAAYTRTSFIDALTTVGPDVLVVETQYDRGFLARMIPWRWTWAHLLVHPYYPVSRYAMVSDHGRRAFGESKLDVDCMADVVDGGLACTVYDGTSTHIVRIDAGSGHVDGMGVLEGHFVSDRNVIPGWLSGWSGSRPVAIHLSTGEVLHLAERAGAALLLSVASDRLYAIMFGDHHFTVQVHLLPSNMRTPDVVRVQRTASAGLPSAW